MSRINEDWLKSFCNYAGFGEAPIKMYFWAGVSAIAGVLKRKVWIDQAYFKWFPNFYIILVAPPGIVSKSTTAGIAMNLLRQVPGVKFGPEVVTWQALVTSFVEAAETFQFEGMHHTMSPLTIESSEFGNLLDPQDKAMVDMLVNLWDGKSTKKVTKGSGTDDVTNPWINLIACTTPSWIAGNFPEYMIGGGFTSRCVFVYTDKKERKVAYPGLEVPIHLAEQASGLIHDLEHIALNLTGEYILTDETIKWGKEWYENHYDNRPAHLDDERFGGYVARKQTHIHKLAMVIAASARDELAITREDLCTANTMVTDLEADMPMVFSKIGRSDISLQTDRFISYVQSHGKIKYTDAYRFAHQSFPSLKDFEGIVTGAMKAGYMKIEQVGGEPYLVTGIPLDHSKSAPLASL